MLWCESFSNFSDFIFIFQLELLPVPAHLDGSVEEHPGAIQEAENREDRVDGEEEEGDPEPEADNSKKTLLRFKV